MDYPASLFLRSDTADSPQKVVLSASSFAPPPATPTSIDEQTSTPDLHFAAFSPSGQPDASIGPGYFLTENQEQGYSEEMLWTQTLPVDQRQSLRVDAFIPGTSRPQDRTAQARYEITHADGVAVVQVSQQMAHSDWVFLGIFAFEPGLASVHLTNETGEPTGTTEIVADAVHWTNA